MITRRALFGLFAAAPVALPAVAKAAMAGPPLRTMDTLGLTLGDSLLGRWELEADSFIITHDQFGKAIEAAHNERLAEAAKMTTTLSPEQRASERLFGHADTRVLVNRDAKCFIDPDSLDPVSFNDVLARYEVEANDFRIVLSDALPNGRFTVDRLGQIVERPRVGDWMQTYTGRAFYPLDPRPDEIHIDDIAHGLALMCRYGGQCLRFYSVAEHCVHVANAAPDHLKLSALMHDASEAYLSDVIRPIKPNLASYGAIENRLMNAIAERFAFEWPMPAEVKRLDNAILVDERDQVMAVPPQDWNLSEPAIGATLQFWSPEKAEFEFKAAFLRFGGHFA